MLARCHLLARSRRGPISSTLAVALAFVGAAAPPAAAATMVGQLFTPDNTTCGGPITAIQTGVASGNSYTVASPGVITSWSFQDASVPVLGLKLKVARPLSDGLNYTMVGESAGGAQQVSVVNTYPARIPVQAGEQIGVFEAGGGCDAGLDSSDTFAAETFDMPLNSTGPLLSVTGSRFPVAAFVEPDADHDGFGDETQDQCPGLAGPDTGCPPPAAAPPPAVTPPPDNTPPAISASGGSSHLSSSGAISFFLTASENSSGPVRATIDVPAKASVLRFKTRNVRLNANVKTKVTLTLSKKNAAKVRPVLKKKRLTAKVTATLEDAAGNATTKKLSVKLRR